MRTVVATAASALLLAAILGAPAVAQLANANAEPALPRSPADLPMEAQWDRAPQAGQWQDAGPYYVSRWGGIVIRGKRDGDRISSALTILHCGAADNPGSDITALGTPPQSLCDSIKPVPSGNSQTVTGNGYTLYGTAKGWTVVDFVQTITGGATDVSFGDGLLPAGSGASGAYGVTHFGAAYHDEYGKHVFYAPGETVDLTHGVTFVVKPAMDSDELNTLVITAGMRKLSEINLSGPTRTKSKPPMWFIVLFFGLPLAAFGGLIYGIRRWIVRRRRQKIFPDASRSADR